MIPQLGWKHVPVLCPWFWGVFPKILFSIFTSQKSSQILRIYLQRPLTGMGEMEQLFPIYIKYTKIYYLWPLLDSKEPF